ncbi:MAG: hypothetical protein Rubg2KO_13480 [Rubricoccaceae bacterium]
MPLPVCWGLPIYHDLVPAVIRSILLSALVALPLAGCATSTPPTASTPPIEPVAMSDPNVDIVGVWTYTVASPGGGDAGTFTITGDPEAYEGEIIAQGQLQSIFSIVHEGTALSFLFQVGNGPVIRCTGVIREGTFEGTAHAGEYGTFPMTATRESNSR